MARHYLSKYKMSLISYKTSMIFKKLLLYAIKLLTSYKNVNIAGFNISNSFEKPFY